MIARMMGLSKQNGAQDENTAPDVTTQATIAEGASLRKTRSQARAAQQTKKATPKRSALRDTTNKTPSVDPGEHKDHEPEFTSPKSEARIRKSLSSAREDCTSESEFSESTNKEDSYSPIFKPPKKNTQPLKHSEVSSSISPGPKAHRDISNPLFEAEENVSPSHQSLSGSAELSPSSAASQVRRRHGEVENTMAKSPAVCGSLNFSDVSSSYHQPQFGVCLLRMPHKVIYHASARELLDTVPIWCKQRPVSSARVSEIADRFRGKFDFPGSISIFNYNASPSVGRPQSHAIFDGQHRSLAMQRLLDEDPNLNFDITIEVFPVKTEEDIKKLFRDLNKAESVQEIDTTDEIEAEEKLCINEAVKALQEKFPEMFGNEKCRVPNLNDAKLRNELYTADITKNFPFIWKDGSFKKSPKDNILLQCILDVNDEISQWENHKFKAQYQKNVKKCRRNNCFLGVVEGWIYDLLIKKLESLKLNN